MADGNINISISAEKVFSIGSLEVSNSILTSLLVSALIIGLAFIVRSKLASSAKKKISVWQNIAEMLVEAFYSFIQGVTDNHKKTRDFFPFIVTFFIFILFNNWLGLLPGIGTIGFIEHHSSKETEHTTIEEETDTHEESNLSSVNQVYALEEETGEGIGEEVENQQEQQTEPVEQMEEESGEFVPIFRAGTADLNTTMALAVLTVLLTQFFGVKYLKLSYFKKFINLSNPMNFIVGILELVSEISKIISFGFRLFGNIFAGEVLLVVVGALIPLIVPSVFYGLEVFVGAIQALVFALLSLVFYSMATTSHEEH